MIKSLTRAEEQIMLVLWKLKSAFLREIVDELAASRPHQNTVATLLKILTEKGYVSIEVVNRYHRYHPAISKDEYSKRSIKQLLKGYFEGSATNVVSFLVKEKDISVEELEALLKAIKKQKK
jgi:BlaI family penicillinase repressor